MSDLLNAEKEKKRSCGSSPIFAADPICLSVEERRTLVSHLYHIASVINTDAIHYPTLLCLQVVLEVVHHEKHF